MTAFPDEISTEEFIGESGQPDSLRDKWSHTPDDDDLALEIAKEWGNRVMHLHAQWYVWEKGCWRLRAPQQLKYAVREQLREYRRYGIKLKMAQINSIAQMLESDLFFADEDYTELEAHQAKYINLKNGMYHLGKNRLEQHNPALRFTSQLDFNYDPKATCPNFRRFLQTSLTKEDNPEETDEAMLQLVQEAMAYSMTSRTDLKSSFWLVGKPNSGKSTMIAFLREMMGSLHATIDLNQMGTNRFLLSSIVGKRIVTFTEASESIVLPDALYKAMVGGTDEIYADVKNRPGIAFKPVAKFWWAMNAAPRMTDRSGATLNRLRVICFPHTLPTDKQVSNLDVILKKERAGVFNWLLVGYQRLLERGAFTRPNASEQWRENYALENDTELTFVQSEVELGTANRVQAESLYSRYREWCDSNGFKAKNANQVAKEWERLGFKRTMSNGRRFYHGLKLRNVESLIF